MSMRWVLSWKPPAEEPSGRKAKARIALLGYQRPEPTELTTSLPTLSRLGRVLTLQWCEVPKAHLGCADAKCAFLQGDGKEICEQEPIYARALDEVACAFNTPLNSAVEVAKAAYGLGNAPRSWWLSVDRFALEQGSTRSRADPTILIFSFGDEDNTTYALAAA